MVAAALLTQVAAASPVPDLRSYLAPAPAGDWFEHPADPTDAIGPFDAATYGASVDDNGASERALGRLGFVSGYGRDWVQRGSQDFLVERVFEFGSPEGAIRWLNDLKTSNETSSEYKQDIPALDSLLVLSFGVELDFSGGREYRVEFVKNDFFYAIHMGSATNDLSAAARAQAVAQYEMAPDNPALPAASVRTSLFSPLIVGSFLASVVLFVALISVIVIVGLTQRRRQASPMPAASVYVSPDGAYWWDGAHWHPIATDPPPRPG